MGSSGKSSGLAAGTVLFLCVGLPIAVQTFVPYASTQFGWSTKIALTSISPSGNTSWSIYDEVAPHAGQNRYGYVPNHERWSARLTAATVSLGIEVLLGLALAAWSVRRVENVHRVRQFRSVARSIPREVSAVSASNPVVPSAGT